MVFLFFHEDTSKSFTSHIIAKSLYLPQMMSDPKNKCTLFPQTFKVEEKKCPYFFIQTSDSWDMSFLWFQIVCSYVHYQFTNHKMSKRLYLPQMTSDPKNKGTLLSSTLKVGEIKVHLFSWSEIILASYDDFVIS